MISNRRNKGIVSILAMLLMVVLCALAVAHMSMASSSVVVSSNHAHVEAARLQAESGLSFLLQTLYSVKLPPGATSQALLVAERRDHLERPQRPSNHGPQWVQKHHPRPRQGFLPSQGSLRSRLAGS
ncbi:MAG: hypothetical protein KAX80_12050 [Planctomycetes bacterium]|nr:hypothetical protein [Planctomycetota bacterium]